MLFTFSRYTGSTFLLRGQKRITISATMSLGQHFSKIINIF
jgi:hypothetical protein